MWGQNEEADPPGSVATGTAAFPLLDILDLVKGRGGRGVSRTRPESLGDTRDRRDKNPTSSGAAQPGVISLATLSWLLRYEE